MKKIAILMAFGILTMNAIAQNSTVTVTLNGNLNRNVYVDGVLYTLNEHKQANNTNTSNYNTVSIPNVAAGQHTLLILPPNVTPATNRNTRNTRVFNIRAGYDLVITVNGNGSINLSERRIRQRRNDNNNTGSYPAAMTDVNFRTLVNEVNTSNLTSRRISLLNSTFSNTANHFTTAQVSQLLLMVSGDANRLPLAKAAYRSVVDPSNFSSVYTLLSSQANRNNLAAYVNSYQAPNYPGNTNTRNQMSDANFQVIYNNVRNTYQTGSKVSMMNNYFKTTGNYFSTLQVMQLLELINNEPERLQLAKMSYRTITDPNNFPRLNNLLNTQSSRDELAYYVRNYNPSNPDFGLTTIIGTTTTVQAAMPDANFNTLYENIRKQWLPGAKKSAVLEAFSAQGNYFSTNQVIRLISLDNDETDRLDMAKASYKIITDPLNFTQVYTLFNTQASRDALAYYVNNYGTSTNSGTVPTGVRVPMTESSFQLLHDDIRKQWLPGAKKSAVINAFGNSGNYFTSAQARLLISLDNDETDRLDMAKASLRSITDPANFSVIYDLFTNQSLRNDLISYVNNYRW